MERRDCSKVIREIISKIPEDKKEFIKDLEWNYNDSIYKAPEEVIQWSRTYDTICRHIPTPREDWEFEVLSVWSCIPINEIRKFHEK